MCRPYADRPFFQFPIRFPPFFVELPSRVPHICTTVVLEFVYSWQMTLPHLRPLFKLFLLRSINYIVSTYDTIFCLSLIVSNIFQFRFKIYGIPTVWYLYICIPPPILDCFPNRRSTFWLFVSRWPLVFYFLVPEGVISPGSRSIYRTPDDIALLFSIFYVVDLVT